MSRRMMVLLGMLICGYSFAAEPVVPEKLTFPVTIFDNAAQEETTKYPQNFRFTDSRAVQKLTAKKLLAHGFTQLHASGSAQFTLAQIKNMKNYMRAPIYIIDLRQESHGFVNDGIPVSQYTKRNREDQSQNVEQVTQAETLFLQQLLLQKAALLVHRIKAKVYTEDTSDTMFDRSEALLIKQVSDEEKLVQSQGMKYQRFAITDHMAPNTEQLQNFLDFYRQLPKNAWVHFHCHSGVGRTTTFLILYDILRNGRRLSLLQILQRQTVWGKFDLMNLSKRHSSAQFRRATEQRAELIRQFYKYVHNGNFANGQTWRDYLVRSNSLRKFALNEWQSNVF